MNTDEIIRNQRKRTVKKPQSLVKEYLRRWYIILLTFLTCIVGYAAEAILYGIFSAMNMPHLLAAVIAIFLGGIISTLPFLILNLVLAFKHKKYYAIAVEIIALELIGMLFFIYNQIGIAGI